MLYDCRERYQNRPATGVLIHGQPYRPHGAKGKGANKPVNGRKELTGQGLVVSDLSRGQPLSQNSNLSVSLQCLNRTRSLVFIISSFFTRVWFSVCTQRSISLLIKCKITAMELCFHVTSIGAIPVFEFHFEHRLILLRCTTTAKEALFSCCAYQCDIHVWFSFWTQELDTVWVQNHNKGGLVFI